MGPSRFIPIAVLAPCVAIASAAPRVFDNDDGDFLWFSGPNWNPDGVPSLSDEVIVNTSQPVLAANLPVEAAGLEVLSGLALTSSSLYLTGPSRIVGLAVSGCCSTNITVDEPLRIEGDSTFLKRPIFRGTDTTTLAGTSVLVDGLTVDDFARLVIEGAAALAGTGQVDHGAECAITGTLSVTTGSLLSAGSGRWLVDGGVAEKVGPGPASVQGNLVLQAGTIRADEGAWDLLEHDLRGGTLEVTNGGVLHVRSSGVPTYDAVSYQGEGVINLYGAAVLGSGGNPIAANVAGGGGLVLRGTLSLGADIANAGSLVLSSATLNGPGRVESTGAVTLSGASLNADLIASGGSVLVTGSSSVSAFIDIRAGASISLLASLNEPSSLAPGRLRLAGAMTHNNFTGGGDVDVRIPVDLEPGGVVRANGGELRLRAGGVWSGGEIEIEQVMQNAAPTLALQGDPADQYLITGEVAITDAGSEPVELLIGAGFGPQPSMRVDGVLTLGIGWSDNTAACFLPEITGAGQIVNEGWLDIQRALDVTPALINARSLQINAALTHSTIANAVAGVVTQAGDVVFRSDAVAQNAGEWKVVGSRNLRKLLPGTTNARFVNTGAYSAQGPFFVSVDVRFENAGLVLADGAQMLFRDAVNVSGGGPGPQERFIVGNWAAINGGRIDFENPPTTVGSPDPLAPPTALTGGSAATPWVEHVDRWTHADANLDSTACDSPTLTFDSCNVDLAPGASLGANDLHAVDTGVTLAPGSACTAGAIQMEGCSLASDGASVAAASLNASGSTIDAGNASLHHYSIGVHADHGTTYTLTGASTLESDGSIEFTGGSSLSLEQGSAADAAGGATVGGFNSVIDDLEGVVSPSFRGPAAPPTLRTPLLDLFARLTPAAGGIGSFVVEGDLLMRPSATLVVESLGPGSTDRAEITGTATLAGTVRLETPTGYTPAVGDSLLVLTAGGGIVGAIDAVAPAVVGGVRWRAVTSGGEVRLLAVCLPDLAAPFGLLDLADVVAFVSAFASQHPDADLDTNGLFDLADLTAFVSAFLSGCD